MLYTPLTMRVDLMLAWDWPYDEPFVQVLESIFRSRRLSLLSVHPANLGRVLDGLSVGRYDVRAFLDRASDTSPAFLPLARWAASSVPRRLNPAERAREVWVKSALCPDLLAAGLPIPDVIRVPALRRVPDLAPLDLAPLGARFCIKPDLGGGGWGVVTDAATWDDVRAARERLPHDDLILHPFVQPEMLRGPDGAGPRRAWFRIVYACGRILPCWWDDRTLVFTGRVTPADRDEHGLARLWGLARALAGVARIQLFSSEIARVAPGRFVVVDFVNDPVDLRLQTHAREGMPVPVALEVAEAIADVAAGADAG